LKKRNSERKREREREREKGKQQLRIFVALSGLLPWRGKGVLVCASVLGET